METASLTVQISFKRCGWCLFYLCSECGLTVVQIGGLVVEVSH